MSHEWVPDETSNHCMECKTEFGFFNRKHHCRLCCRLLCGGCSSKSCPLPQQGPAPQRVCEHCFLYESRRVAAETRYFPLLQNGALFLKYPHSRGGAPKSRYVRLSDNRSRLVWRAPELAKASDMPSDADYELPLKQISSVCFSRF
jgi:hypothetical protein